MSWNTEANGAGTSYAAGSTLTLTTSLTLYAQWRAAPVHALYGAVGLFKSESAVLTKNLKDQIGHLALDIRSEKYTKVTLFGYTANTGLASLNRSLSTERAMRVAAFLRSRLRSLKVKGVAIQASGEGVIGGSSSPLYSRVEVFVG